MLIVGGDFLGGCHTVMPVQVERVAVCGYLFYITCETFYRFTFIVHHNELKKNKCAALHIIKAQVIDFPVKYLIRINFSCF